MNPPLHTWINPLAFCRLMDWEPDDWQKTVLTSKRKRMLINCGRQQGKSTATSLLALFRTITRRNHLTLMISPSDRQSGELFKKVLEWLDKLPHRPDIRKQTMRELDIAGSRIVSLPSSSHTIRGFSAVNLLLEDEAAFVDDDLHEAVTPMLAVSNGDMMLMSSPNGQRGHFWRHWSTGGEDWERVTASAANNKRISADWLASERRAKGEAQFRQEYLCEFLAASSGLVYGRFVPELHVVDRVPQCNRHVIGVDYGFVDECAFTVIGWRENDSRAYILESWKEKGLIPSKAAETVKRLDATYKADRIVGDLGGLGKGYAEEAIQRWGIPIEAAEKHNKNGYISIFNDALERAQLFLVKHRTDQLQEEWRNLVWAEKQDKELPGLPNHCSDSALYAFRASQAFWEKPADKEPAMHSPEFYAAMEARMALNSDNQVRQEQIGQENEWDYE